MQNHTLPQELGREPPPAKRTGPFQSATSTHPTCRRFPAIANATRFKNLPLSPLDFLFAQGLNMNLLAVPIALAGLWGLLVSRDGRPFRALGFCFLAILALMIGYSAFIAEVFRAGILSVDKGQVEAAKALGLSRYQRFRLVIFPQAIRVILPPLGNDFIAMVKDSSLVSVLGVADITQMGKVYASGSFRFFETYSIVAYVYLVLTIGLSLGLRGLERRLRRAE